MKEIILTRGHVARISDHRYEEYSKFKWHFVPVSRGETIGYAARGVWNKDTKKMSKVFMHNEIMQPKEGEEVDHLSRYGLDNQDENLAIKTHAGNLSNRGRFTSNKSGHKNVYYVKKENQWQVRVSRNFKSKEMAFHVADLFQDIWGKIEERLMQEELVANSRG